MRIWPLYLAVLAIFAVLLGGGLTSAPFLVTFTYNWVSWVQPTTPFLAHLWSVCVEEQLYILIPILASLRLKRRVPILIALSSVALLSRFLTPIFFPYPAVWNFTTSHLDVFSLGVLLASLDAAGSEKWLSFRSKFGIRKYSFLWFSLGVIVLMFSVIIWPSAVFESIYSSVSYAVVAILFGFFFLILTESQIGAKFKFMHWIGQRSYGIYLFHWPIVLLGIEIATNQGFPLPLVGLISLISSLILAEFSYRFFESKILSLKKRFTIFRLA